MSRLRALLWLLVLGQPVLLVVWLTAPPDAPPPSSPQISATVERTAAPADAPSDAEPSIDLAPDRRSASLATDDLPPDTANPLGRLLWGVVRTADGEVLASPHVSVWAPDGGPASIAVGAFEDGRYVAALPADLAACELRIGATGHHPLSEQVALPPAERVIRHDLRLRRAPADTLVHILTVDRIPLTAEHLKTTLQLGPYWRPTATLAFAAMPDAANSSTRFDLESVQRFDWSSGVATASIRGTSRSARFALLFGGTVLDTQAWNPGQPDLTFSLDPTTIRDLMVRIDVAVRAGALDGGPVANASVTAIGGGRTTTDAEGRATLRTLPGRQSLEVSAPGHLPWAQQIEAGPGQSLRVEVILPAMRRLTGRLLTEAGEPPGTSHIQIEALTTTGDSVPAFAGFVQATPDTEGRFTVEAPATPLFLSARLRTLHGLQVLRHHVPAGDGDVVDLELRLRPAAELYVTQPPGAPRRGGLLVFRDAAGQPLALQRTFSSIPLRVPPGPVTLEVHRHDGTVEKHALDLTLRPHGHRLQLR